MHITVYLDRLKGTNPALVHTLHELDLPALWWSLLFSQIQALSHCRHQT